MPARRLLLFDLYAEGHHAEYIRHVAAYWIRHGMEGNLDLVVSPRLLDRDPRLAALAAAHADRGLRVLPEPASLDVDQSRRFGLLRAGLAHGRLLRRHVAAHRPDEVLLMYFDHAQLALAAGLHLDDPVRLSGIFFRPTLHYPRFGIRPAGVRGRLAARRKTLLLGRALRNPHFSTLFCLDPLAVPSIEALAPQANVVHLPEAYEHVRPSRSADALRRELGVRPDRKVLLLFGALAERKGVYELLESLLLLPPEAAARLCLVMAGRMMDVDEARVRRLLARIEATSEAQVLVRDALIPDADVPDLFGAADLVLLPYQHHVGSSGILVRAAHAGLPVLGSGYGLLGEQIRRRRLGLAVDATRPSALAEGLQTFLRGPADALFDPDEARRFADENTADAFARTLFDHLLDRPEVPAGRDARAS